MRALLFVSLLGLSACASPLAPDPPACVTTLAYDNPNLICGVPTSHGPVCLLAPEGGTHPVTVCR